MSDERRMVYAGIRTPEDAIRELVKNVSGYDVPLLSFSPMNPKGGVAKMIGAAANTYNNAKAVGNTFDGGLFQTAEQQAKKRADEQADWDRQVAAQQKRSDALKADAQRRGLVR